MYNYISEINHVSRVYIAAAILSLQFLARVMLFPMLNVLYFYISTLQCMCVVPNIAVSVLPSCRAFPVCWLGYFRNDFEIIPVAAITAGIAFVFTFHMPCISILRCLLLLLLLLLV